MSLLIRQCGPYQVECRWLIRRDLDEVLETERLCFRHPWTHDEFVRSLRQNGCIGMVAEIPAKQRVIGHMVYWLEKGTIDVGNFAVHPEYQRLGVGTFMLDKLRGKLSPNNRKRLIFPVSEENLDAQLWLRSRGLRCVSVKRNYWPGHDLAAYVFQWRLPVAVESAS